MRFIPWAQDKWFSREGSILPWDKVEHFLLGIIGWLLLFYVVGLDETQCFVLGIIAAVAWEVRDGFITGFSWKDLIAGVAGMVCGVLVVWVF